MRPGDVVADRFELERVAGAGGMGRVFRARDRLTGEVVALKVLYGAEASIAERLRREAELLAALRHPGIVRYIAHGSAGGELYLAIEWLEGCDLAERLAAGPLPTAEAVALVRRAAEALGEAHAAGVVHRDVKPSNIFLVGGDPACVRLIDFGVARLGAGQAGTRTGTAIGTPGYMAPEQARGERAVDARADVFSLGCVLFECASGRAPFVAENAMGVLAKILLEEPPRLGEICRAPPALDALVARMMAKEPAARLPDGRAVAGALSQMEGSLGAAPEDDEVPSAGLTTGERRLICAVMAAGVGPRLEPERWRALEEIAATHGARVEPLADGSLVVTVIGAGPATDQAARAARCALAVRALLPGAAVAMATGRGEVAGRRPVGEVIDRAVRLLGLGAAGAGGADPPAPVRVDEVTAGLLDVRFEVGGDAAGLTLRGEREIVESARTLLGRPTPCVGRERELLSLTQLLGEVIEDRVARAALVTGAAGVGKSRLRYELVRAARARPDGVEVWIARGDPLRAGSPFGLIAPVVRRVMGILDSEPVEVARQKVRARVGRHLAGGEQQRVAEFMGELAGVPFPDEGSVELRAARKDPMLMADQRRRAFEDWLRAECEARPLLLVLEDLQWGDWPSAQLVGAALLALEEQPLFVLALARPEIRELWPRLWEGRPLQELRLGELSRKSGERLARAVLGDSAPAATVERVVAQAAGNAFYLEELLRAVAEGKGEALPETVLAMAQARLEALDPEARQALRAASVFGQVFWAGGVAELLGGRAAPERVRGEFDELCRVEVIARRQEARFPGQAEYVFRHALIREAAYAALTDADRALGHRLAAAWLEQAGEREAAALAEHLERGGAPAQAAAHYLRAAEQALEGDDLPTAIARAERAIACAPGPAMAGPARWIQAEALLWAGDYSAVQARAEEALAALPRGISAWFRSARALLLASARLSDRARVETWAEAVRATPAVDDAAVAPRLIALCSVAWPLFLWGSSDAAAALCDEVAGSTLVREGRDPIVEAQLARTLGLHAAWGGDFGAAALAWERAAAKFDRAGNLRESAGQRINLGFAHLSLGRYADAERALREAMARGERAGLPGVVAGARHNLGMALAYQGALADARALEEQAVAAFREQRDVRLLGGSLIYLARIQLLSGDAASAEASARAAAEALAGIPPMRRVAQAALADALLAQGSADEALRWAREAAASLAGHEGLDGGEAHLRLTHARALRAAGEAAASAEAIRLARERLLARAAKIRDPAWRESFLCCVPENVATLALAREWLGEA